MTHSIGAQIFETRANYAKNKFNGKHQKITQFHVKIIGQTSFPRLIVVKKHVDVWPYKRVANLWLYHQIFVIDQKWKLLSCFWLLWRWLVQRLVSFSFEKKGFLWVNEGFYLHKVLIKLLKLIDFWIICFFKILKSYFDSIDFYHKTLLNFDF